ncbi:hypothetical protein CKM354_000092200 [Cercospora kikuchii]|uniref:methylcrotonoyl-CoA carboxylase n=1 Tax=Cercospora kikuchii TaxID=84275 RepID=A0A9P3C9X0_9PEZI|nr:uncharacterized protein CKM354_000092200 [Cercospora kikuchii]GIZ37477.1 hypothetical protein CKM354_000092200 [Cercospora kikuchii]
MASTNSYPVISSEVNLGGPQFQANRAAWEDLLLKFERASIDSVAEGGEQYLLRHQQRGQLLARDRIALLLDPDSPFLELCPFAGWDQEDIPPCGNIISGIGSVCGRPVVIISHIPTQNGGSWSKLTVPKQNRVTEIANENNLPIVALVQSAGVFLPHQFDIFHKGGQLFRDLSQRSQNGQQSCAIVFGSSTAGGAYQPAMSDYTIFVKGQAQVFLGGPPLVKMATGEIVDAETLGGAETHAKLTGLADQIAVDEFDAIRKAREWMLTLPEPSPDFTAIDAPLPPRYSPEELLSLVDPDIRKPFDMTEVLIRIVDDSRISMFKPSFGSNLITAYAQIMGHNVGIIANRIPVINGDEASKGAQFIRLCNQSNLPILFLHNVTGFMVGTKAEHSAIIKKGAQMVSAVSCSKVPHISVILGASYGAGNYAMCGRSYKPRFMFTWPTGRCSVMGPDQLAGVMQNIEANSAKSKGKVLDQEAVTKRTEVLKQTVLRDCDPYRTSSALHDDGVIDPRDTRDIVGMCLEVVKLPGVEGAAAHSVLARL